MSIADSVLSMRVPAPFQPLSGRISKQSSLSIHSNNPLGPSGALSGLTGEKSSVRASPVQSSVPRDLPTTLPTSIPSSYKPATSPSPHVARQDTKLPRQESSFTQEEIYRYLKKKRFIKVTILQKRQAHSVWKKLYRYNFDTKIPNGWKQKKKILVNIQILWHIVWILLKMSHLNFWHFPPIFVPVKTDLSGNTVWPQASGFQNGPFFFASLINFCPFKM